MHLRFRRPTMAPTCLCEFAKADLADLAWELAVQWCGGEPEASDVLATLLVFYQAHRTREPSKPEVPALVVEVAGRLGLAPDGSRTVQINAGPPRFEPDE